MITKSGRRKLADALSKVRIEVLEQRILLSADGLPTTLKFLQQPVFDPTTDTISATVEALDADGNPAGAGSNVNLQVVVPGVGSLISYFPTIPPSAFALFSEVVVEPPLAALATPSAVIGADGIATFSGLHVTDEGSYSLIAYTNSVQTSPGVWSSSAFQQSDSFQVGASDAQAPIPLGWGDARLPIGVSQTPRTATVGNPLAPITVQILNPENGEIDTSYNGEVTISVGDGGPEGGISGGVAGGATDGLSGAVVTAVNGIAIFNSLTITKGAPYYDLQISAANLAPITPPPINNIVKIIPTIASPGKFAAAPRLRASTFNIFAKAQIAVADQLLNPDAAAGGVLSMLNSPFSRTGSNPLLS
ncbi:MAG TPA: LEPR-XLL domain-containing protein [Tepidisphaeraceae bacterium]|jgi:hypothetical protein